MTGPTINLAGEGYLDLAVMRRLVTDAGFSAGPEYGLKGKAFIGRRLPDWNRAAQFAPWFVVRDLDHDGPCDTTLISTLMAQPSAMMCFRIAVRETEIWLLADRDNCIAHLGFRNADIPVDVETLPTPEDCLLRAARKSTIRDIRDGLTVTTKSGELVEGDNYNAQLSVFAHSGWNPRAAANTSPSLHKARIRLSELAARGTCK